MNSIRFWLPPHSVTRNANRRKSGYWLVRAGDEHARPWSRRSPRAFASWHSNGRTLFTPQPSSPPSIAMRPRVAAGSSTSGTSLPAAKALHADAKRSDWRVFTPACSPPPSVCSAPARYGAFVDARRIVGGDEGGRGRTRNAHQSPSPVHGFDDAVCQQKVDLKPGQRLELVFRMRASRKQRAEEAGPACLLTGREQAEPTLSITLLSFGHYGR
jgi:hypothetical protein